MIDDRDVQQSRAYRLNATSKSHARKRAREQYRQDTGEFPDRVLVEAVPDNFREWDAVAHQEPRDDESGECRVCEGAGYYVERREGTDYPYPCHRCNPRASTRAARLALRDESTDLPVRGTY